MSGWDLTADDNKPGGIYATPVNYVDQALSALRFVARGDDSRNCYLLRASRNLAFSPPGKRLKISSSMNTEVEAAVVSIRENTDEGKARINLRWEGNHQISDFDVDKLGKVVDSEDETEHSGWVFVELPVAISVGKTIPLLKQ